ncbi:hypothetical protein TNCV_1747171 [Trichonephila clavipes]|nr:hypothetical protein TNCV_1747171 [Trichonephila clavipes]
MRSFLKNFDVPKRRKKTLKCWTCGREGHLQAAGHANSQKVVSEKLINGHLVGRRLPDFGKPQCVKFRPRVPVRMEFLLGHVTASLQHDHRYRSQCVYHSERSGFKRETYGTPRGATDRDGGKD